MRDLLAAMAMTTVDHIHVPANPRCFRNSREVSQFHTIQAVENDSSYAHRANSDRPRFSDLCVTGNLKGSVSSVLSRDEVYLGRGRDHSRLSISRTSRSILHVCGFILWNVPDRIWVIRSKNSLSTFLTSRCRFIKCTFKYFILLNP